jgi:glycosyltransferase involved in cell wall biosynthesis
MEPLKVLILGRDPDVFAKPGGAPNDTRERHVRYVRELQRRRPGSQVRIVAHTFGRGPKTEQPIAGMSLYGTQSRHRLLCPFGAAMLMKGFHREGWVPDVISCQTGYEEGPIALFLAMKASRIQIQLHSNFYGEAFARERFVQRVQRAIIRWSIRRCDQARAVSDSVRQALLDAGDIEPERIAVAPVPAVFKAAEREADPKRPVVLFVGRLVAVKDLGLWCDAAELAHQALPEAEFWIAGDGEERAMLESRLPAFEGKLRLLGEVAHSELPGVYAKASAFMMTSLYEGLPRVVVEAMLAKVPVVSVDVVGPRDLIEDGKTGRLVARNPRSMADALIEVLTDKDLSRRIADDAYDVATTAHSFDAVAAKLVDSWEAASCLPKRRA